MKNYNMEIKSTNKDKEIIKLKLEVNKRDNIIKLLTGVIEVIKTDVNIKTQQLDYLINHMKNSNYEEFDYKTCINSLDKEFPLKDKLKDIKLENTNNYEDINIYNENDNSNKNLKTINYDTNKEIFKNISGEIFLYLNAKDLTYISMTNKSFNKLATDHKIWRELYFKEYDNFLFFDDKDNCKVVDRAREKYESDKKSYEDLDFNKKYSELKQIARNWELNRPIVTTLSTSESVTCINLDPDLNEMIYSGVASASRFKMYSLRKIAQNEELYMQHHKQTKICDRVTNFHGHAGPIWCIDRSSDTLFTGSYDKTIKIWDVKTGYCKNTIRAHNGWVSSLQYDAKYDTLVSSSWDSTIKLWDMRTFTTSWKIEYPVANYIHCVRLNLIDNEIIAGTELKTIDIWDIVKRVKNCSFYGHLGRITNLKYSNNLILSGNEDKQARLWDKRTGKCEILFSGHTRGITQIEYDPVNSRVFTSSIDKTIKIWDIRKNTEIRTLIGHSATVTSIGFDQTKLISGSKDNTIRIWNFLY